MGRSDVFGQLSTGYGNKCLTLELFPRILKSLTARGCELPVGFVRVIEHLESNFPGLKSHGI